MKFNIELDINNKPVVIKSRNTEMPKVVGNFLDLGFATVDISGFDLDTENLISLKIKPVPGLE